ncbi:uncharacterized protein FPRO_04879 [Fusarium proliferatum ET1]|uniref:Uncharacterized protein n=2 Tax=Gibberella intermedia TaxID=948311 RepID=A0A1L7VH79_FUSPR|nr:uncharacterized protein FPRO_04879 [Fusarium proliferatum ET1]CVL10161.1 uncharacterized protein FPRN_04731 [Fusarium proliferatum]CZR39981.1 uncharacterized protein FPRO_04879 [Fusarium proliferatum ET1]
MSTARLHIKSRNVYQLLRGDLTLPCALVAQSSHHAALSTLSNSIRYQTRSYATPKGARKPLRPPPRAPKLVKAQTNSSSQTDFDLSQISPMDFELAMRASENQVEIQIPVEAAHEMACLLWLLRRLKAHTSFSMALWASASGLNYSPAVVSLASQLFASGSWRKTTAFADAENRFMKLVAEAKNCNALTVYGEYLFQDGKYDQAVAMLNQALNVDDGVFEWKRKGLICLAKSYAKLGRAHEAKKTLELLGDSEADAELDQLLRSSDAEMTRQQLYTDAVKGKHDLFSQLAEVEFERETKETDVELKKNHHLWGLEWSRLADPGAKF